MPIAKLISLANRQVLCKLRVAAYCRVSSNSADQKNSFATQERVYRKRITENWIGSWSIFLRTRG